MLKVEIHSGFGADGTDVRDIGNIGAGVHLPPEDSRGIVDLDCKSPFSPKWHDHPRLILSS